MVVTAVLDPVSCNGEVLVRSKVFVDMNEAKAELLEVSVSQIIFTAISLKWSI